MDLTFDENQQPSLRGGYRYEPDSANGAASLPSRDAKEIMSDAEESWLVSLACPPLSAISLTASIDQDNCMRQKLEPIHRI
jgi:hypothetical protein